MSAQSIINCPLCGDAVEQVLYRFHLESEQEVISRIRNDHHDWVEQNGACTRCMDYYQTEVVMHHRMLPEAGPHFPVRSVDDFIILPTPLRVDADPHYTGRGITICIIDSGFYFHDDLVKTKNRIKIALDITDKSRPGGYFERPHPESWHGTMTSVVCAGDGYASQGLYKGIASNADLVLLKVQTTQEGHPDNGRIASQSLVAAFQWVLDHHANYNIRVVSISVGDDFPQSNKDSRVSQLAEQLISAGVTIVAAAGNDLNGQLKPPASSPNVITVGGLDDLNQLTSAVELYHSTFGKTLDGFMKPELVANAIWVAAPILPDTSEKREAECLHHLIGLDDGDLVACILADKGSKLKEYGFEINPVAELKATDIRQFLIQRIQATKFFSPSYMHVDGTSFAAPIISAVVAQLLQCNPSLTPHEVRAILFKTSKRIPGQSAERQGFGKVHPRKAIIQTLRRERLELPQESPFINKEYQTIVFFFHHDGADQVNLAGSFNGWASDSLFLTPGKNGKWKIEIPMLPTGVHQYKFLIDEHLWIEDTNNPFREPDNFGGFNSIIRVE